MYIKVDEAHQRIDFVCVNPTCDLAKQRPAERVTAKMVRVPSFYDSDSHFRADSRGFSRI